jgi:hypothetical protein
LPGLAEEVSSTRALVEAQPADPAADQEGDIPTVVQPAPFEQVAGDIDDHSGLAVSAGRGTGGEQRAEGGHESASVGDEPRRSLGIGIAATVAVGLAAGLGFALLFWWLGSM